MEQIFGIDTYLDEWNYLQANDPDCKYSYKCIWWYLGIPCPCKCYDEYEI